MSEPFSASVADTTVRAYRFGGVEYDLRRQALAVDGAEVAATPLTLRLLRRLCEADGRLLTRDELFAALWPGGQEISDVALSQQIWRLRTALGPYASLVACCCWKDAPPVAYVCVRAAPFSEAAWAFLVATPLSGVVAGAHRCETYVRSRNEVLSARGRCWFGVACRKISRNSDLRHG
jgi:hypothetical protein